MNTAEFHELEQTLIPYGEHMGRTFDSVTPCQLFQAACQAATFSPEFFQAAISYLEDPTVAPAIAAYLEEETKL